MVGILLGRVWEGPFAVQEGSRRTRNPSGMNTCNLREKNCRQSLAVPNYGPVTV